MFSVTINGRLYQVKENLSIIEACDSLAIKIPRFCYLKGLSIPANCRMCLVEIKGGRKLVPACHTLISNGMEIFTESKNVVTARKKIMSYLLINHPLDCPICDEAGECELQNQAVAFGFNDSYYEFHKRARIDLYLGPLISTSMNKCINCTRCIRFMNEVVGTIDLGVLNRGENADISNYLNKPIDSELSGNLVDVCPVGALNNAQYLYRDRPWELTNIKTIDIIDPLCSEIIVNLVGEEVVRILPIHYPIINTAWTFFYKDWFNVKNEEDIISSPLWISDKTRYMCDALDIQRIDTPWIKVGGKLIPATFEEAFSLIKSKIVNLTGKEIAALAGKFADVESMLLLKELLASLGSDIVDCRLNNIAFNSNDRNSYIFNTTLEGINEADCILMVGTNPKKEVPVLNSIIRKRFLETGLPIGVIGEDINLNYNTINLGTTILSLLDILDDKNNFAKVLQQSKKPMLILGEDAFREQDFNEVMSLVYAVCNKFKIVTDIWNGYNFIHNSVGNIGGIDIGFINNKITVNDILNKTITREIKFVWLLNVDEKIDFNKLNNSFVVYMGHHGDKGAEIADVVLPSALWLEKNATFVNIEGKILQTSIVKKAPKNAKEDWKIIKALSDFLGYSLQYNTLSDIRVKMEQINKVFSNKNINNVISNSKDSVFNNKKSSQFNLKEVPISSIIKDYYLTDVISRNSSTLAKCSQLFNKNNSEKGDLLEKSGN